jgi:hypothetical protein
MIVRELMEVLAEYSPDSIVKVSRYKKDLPSKLEDLGTIEDYCEVIKPEPSEAILFVKGDEI